MIWAAQNEIVAGIGDGKFDPNGDATREQTATILHEYAMFKGCDVNVYADLSVFPDADQISDFAQEPMVWAVAESLISGAVVNGQMVLDPQGVTTREQFAMIMAEYVMNVLPPVPDEPEQPTVPTEPAAPAEPAVSQDQTDVENP